jgi:hypothetical protein
MVMKVSDLNKLIEKKVSDMLEEYTNDLADIINEAIDIKLTKILLKESKKVSLKEQVLGKASGADEMAEIAFGERTNEALINKAKSSFSTGIFEDYGGKKPSMGKVDKQHETSKPLTEISGDIKDYDGNKEAMIDDLASADYSDLLD